MFRLLKALPLTLALVAISIFATSCGSGNGAQIRVVHAISDAPGLDIDVNGVKVFTDITFTEVQPTPPAYTTVASGTDSLEAFDTGSTTPVINSTSTPLSGSTQYTVLLTGFLNGSGVNAPAFNLIPDDNTVPTAGNVKIRIIDGSANTPEGGFDVYIVQPGTDIENLSPQISGLLLGQSGGYVTINITNNVYEVVVTPNGTKFNYVDQNYTINTGSIVTLVVVDNTQGGVSEIPIQLDDLQ